MPKISVIVPVYNTEKYFIKCLNSILNQTFTDFELILVDDGSSDNSPRICDDYAKKDSRVQVIHKENSGVSSARNVGLRVAKGEYICFIDSDDWVENDFLQTFLSKAKKDIDCVVTSIAGCPVDFKDECINFKADTKIDYFLFANFIFNCNKLYKRKIILENKLYYDEKIKYGEDAVFSYLYLSHCKKIITSSVKTYYYNKNENSASKKKYRYLNSYLFKRTIAFKKLIKSINIGKDFQSFYLFKKAFDTYLFVLTHYKLLFNKKEALTYIKETQKMFYCFLRNSKIINKIDKKSIRKVWSKKAVVYVKILCKIKSPILIFYLV